VEREWRESGERVERESEWRERERGASHELSSKSKLKTFPVSPDCVLDNNSIYSGKLK
jgi:hypothetical protein